MTHLINASGNIIESYRYDAFGAVAIYNGGGTQIVSTAYNNRFLFTGREYAATYQNAYVPAFKFYEYRARAYNPQLGRFMSEDHKLADTGNYNLFRYCHNDPINHTDPMGLTDSAVTYSPRQTSQQVAEDRAYNFIMGLMQRQRHQRRHGRLFSSSGGSGLTNAVGGLMTAQGPPGQAASRSANAPNLNPAFLREGKKDVDESGKYAEKHNEPTGYNIYQRPNKTVFSQQAIYTEYAGANQYIEHYAPILQVPLGLETPTGISQILKIGTSVRVSVDSIQELAALLQLCIMTVILVRPTRFIIRGGVGASMLTAS